MDFVLQIFLLLVAFAVTLKIFWSAFRTHDEQDKIDAFQELEDNLGPLKDKPKQKTTPARKKTKPKVKNPTIEELSAMTKKELLALAEKRKLEARTSWKKDKIVEFIAKDGDV